MRNALTAAGEPPEVRSTVAGLIHAGVTIAVVGSLLSLLTGYISVARFLTYELVWFDLVLCSFYLLSSLTQYICENLFSAHHASGKTIKQLFGLDDIHLEQASTVMSAVGRSLLLAITVSALPVGIGLGFQEVVKNFISGLILLTERPVKVGDMDSIAGVEGDIRRINARATEIQLADRSTVIVPNSHLISQNLRNVTMGNRTQGVTTLTLIFPLNIDPEQVRDLLLAAYEAHPSILDHPAPSVMFSQRAADGITLSVTGYVRSPRITADTKSDLLFDILKRLRAAAVTVATPQTVIIRDLREVDTGSSVVSRE
ncbi:small-conductance mechanosensitive channel [Paraburkholderia sp. 40]